MTRRIFQGWRVVKHGVVTVHGCEYFAEQLEQYNGKKVYLSVRFDPADSSKSIGFAAYVSNAGAQHIVSINWDGEVVDPKPTRPSRCTIRDGLCLCQGGAHVMCQAGREIDQGRRELLTSFKG